MLYAAEINAAAVVTVELHIGGANVGSACLRPKAGAALYGDCFTADIFGGRTGQENADAANILLRIGKAAHGYVFYVGLVSGRISIFPFG